MKKISSDLNVIIVENQNIANGFLDEKIIKLLSWITYTDEIVDGY